VLENLLIIALVILSIIMISVILLQPDRSQGLAKSAANILDEEKEGIVVQNDGKNNVYPMPINAQDTDEVYVGRIRKDFSADNALNLWVVADNIRKGAATNTIQIAETLIKEGKL